MHKITVHKVFMDDQISNMVTKISITWYLLIQGRNYITELSFKAANQ